LRYHKVLDDVLRAVDNVAHGPAAVDEDVLVLVLDQRLSEWLDSLAQDFQFGSGLAAAEVRQRPRAVAGHRVVWRIAQKQLGQFRHRTSVDYRVSRLDVVTSDVTNAPDSLIDDLRDL
jgi:hypothetical protein